MKLKISITQQLLIFFILTFVIGWPAFTPVMTGHTPPTFGAFIFLYSPAVAALVTAFLANGWTGIKAVLAGYFRWKFSMRWYLLVLLALPAFFLAAGLVQFLTQPNPLWTGSSWYFVIASFVFLMVINSGEEIGWRGFALARLQTRIKSPLVASLVLGLVWGAWHLPMYLDPQQSAFPLPLFLLFIIGISILYTVVFNHTRGSLWMAVILHASTDIAPRFMQIAHFSVLAWSVIVTLTWIAALVLYFATNHTPPVRME